MTHVGKDERILVSVRMRPLNAKEIAGNDPSDWDCFNATTIVFKNSSPERTLYPTSYTFDKVFGFDCTTQQVYVEGAKDVALSVVNGINASIFAYGQTSSGKTYTMTGITDYAIEDIYDYIKKHKERDFVLKFSAMEIYNEVVRDLLSNDSTPLRLLDDAERGTVVEKLTEETLSNQMHLKELLSFCEAQRQVGETSLNEASSRSHQILRLTIESTPHMFTGKGNSSTLLAAANFVDLAGSERASQISSSGVRVKEGCHINRSLLTLGKVIRQLSKGRSGHIPYRDSKLTRILQPFLGGNARTAIICTMSPARSHVEQSRNTLSFAICAKQVVTNARVNLVMSDKQMVKLLKLELARLENELRQRGFETCTNHSDKDAQIRKMEQEIKELMHQRDFSQSRLQDLLRFVGEPRQWDQFSQSEISLANSEYEDTYSISNASGITYQIPDFDSTTFDIPEERDGYNRMHLELLDQMNPSRCSISSETIYEDQCKEVQCIEIHDVSTSGQFNLLSNENESLQPSTDVRKLQNPSLQCDEDTPCTTAIEQSIYITTKTNGNSEMPDTEGSFPSPWVPETMHSKVSVLTRSRSCIASLMNDSILAWLENVHHANKTEPSIFKNILGAQPECSERRTEDEVLSVSVYQDIQRFTSVAVIEIEDIKIIPQDADCNDHASSELNVVEDSQNQRLLQDEIHNEELPLTSTDVINIEDIKTIHQDVDNHADTTSMLNMMESQNQKLLQECQENQEVFQLPFNQCAQQAIKEDNEVHKNTEDVRLGPMQNSLETSWSLEFEKKRHEIIELWQAYNVSLIHRTCFFLLFKGDQSDAFYMEVERRRLSFLGTISCGKAGDVMVEDVNEFRPAASLRYLCRERERLCKEMKKKLETAERKKLFAEWGVSLNSKKRNFQLSQRLWTKTNIEHARASASLVAKLIGFVEQGEGMKEMFILSFTPQKTRKRSFGRRYSGCGMAPFALIK